MATVGSAQGPFSTQGLNGVDGSRPFGAADAPQLSPEARYRIDEQRSASVGPLLRGVSTQFPSSRQRTQGEIINLTLALETLGNPFSVRRVPFSVLRDMTTDPMLSFAHYYTKVPLMRADYYIKCEDAQIAAAVDEALRPVNPRIQNQICNKLSYGYQPMCKAFKLGELRSFYRDARKGDPDKDLPTWTSSVPALLWKDPTVLAPEHCLPRWNDQGELSGFTYSLIPIPNPIQAGITELFGYQTIPGYVISSEFAVWPVNDRDEAMGCSPPDELVLTTRGYKAIGDLDSKVDRLVSYSRQTGRILRGLDEFDGWAETAKRMRVDGFTWMQVAKATGLNSKEAAYERMKRWDESQGFNRGFTFDKGVRPYSGDLLTIEADQFKARVTTNHKFTVRWSEEANSRWAVYLMRKGSWWRIGISVLHSKRSYANAGVGNRMLKEQAEEAWVVSTFATKKEALYYEALWSQQYHIPDFCFRSTPGCTLEDADLASIWDLVDSRTGALKLLSDNLRDVQFPMYVRDGVRNRSKQAGYYSWTCVAVNLLPGVMELPCDPGGREKKPSWSGFSIQREHYDGLVVSLDVEPHHHYISSGIITQNSIYGRARLQAAYRYWWSYWYRWALSDRMYESSADPVKVVYYPTDVTDGIDPNDPNPNSPTALSLQAKALEIGAQARQGSTLALPGDFMRDESTGKTSNIRKWVIQYLENKADFAALDKTFTQLDALKFRAYLLPEEAFVQPGQGQRAARNVATQLGELYQEAGELLAFENDEEINRHFIPQFIAANFPDRADIPCAKETLGFGAQDAETLKQIIQLVGQVKGEVLPVDIRELFRRMKLPLMSESQQKKMEDQIAKEAAASQPPQVPPSRVGMQGYNAGVEKTPQGLSVYVQGPERIDLSTSYQGFLADLPDVPPYRDAAVRSSMMRLRKVFLDRYEAQVGSFTQYLRDRTTLRLAQQAQQTAPTSPQAQAQSPPPQGLHEDAAAGVAATLVSGWLALQAVDGTADVVKGLLYGIALRAGTSELKRANLQATVDPGSIDAWSKRRSQFVVGSVDSTLRGEFTTFLKDRLQQATDPVSVADAAEERFADTPRTHADRVVMSEVLPAYNLGALTALQDAGVQQVQAHDASDGRDELTDSKCKAMNGTVMTVEQALIQAGDEHPAGTLYFTALSTDDLQVLVVGSLPDSASQDQTLLASYDADHERLYVLDSATDEQRREFTLAVGGALVLT